MDCFFCSAVSPGGSFLQENRPPAPPQRTPSHVNLKLRAAYSRDVAIIQEAPIADRTLARPRVSVCDPMLREFGSEVIELKIGITDPSRAPQTEIYELSVCLNPICNRTAGCFRAEHPADPR
jgi:hypothetical protein